jgi:hypothetical protein
MDDQPQSGMVLLKGHFEPVGDPLGLAMAKPTTLRSVFLRVRISSERGLGTG